MNVRCQFCRQTFNLGRDFMATAVAEAEENKQKHVTVECKGCRKTIKVPLKQMKRYIPAPSEPESAD